MGVSDTVIRLDHLTKRFGSMTAVDGVELDFQENEFFALLGPSGCGKTTLLRMIAGFEIPDEGKVLLDGNDITQLRPNRRPVNLMFQSYALFPHMTVRKNISYGLEMDGINSVALNSRVDETLETTQLDELAGRKPDQLSGGQRQRVALARALIKRPRVLLLDEPLSALDKKLRGQMQLELKRLQHEVGITFVVVTHDQEEALVMADRIALMRDGVVEQCGKPHDLYENPGSRFVAEFIGAMNTFDGKLTDNGVEINGLGLLRGAVENNSQAGMNATLAVRPERIKITKTPPMGEDNSISGKVDDLAYHGQDLGVHVRLENGAMALVRVSAADPIAESLSDNTKIWCAWSPRHSRILTS
ncbi:MAG: ABC transporter ATP-binding protein [Rhodospirillales bacterium]|nr:ABC transporter ATP-binding protein [Rhodospirillales bacterium]